MTSPYDKLGDLLNEALDKGYFPPKNKNVEKNAADKSESDIKSNIKSNISNQSVQKYIHLYKVFNLSPECTSEELKTSYHDLLKKYHPDNYSGFPETQKMAENKTREIIKAYNQLLEFTR